jgi:hypothetical protein
MRATLSDLSDGGSKQWRATLRFSSRAFLRCRNRAGSADQLMPLQAAGMPCYSVAEEITPVRGEFELMTIAACILWQRSGVPRI